MQRRHKPRGSSTLECCVLAVFGLILTSTVLTFRQRESALTKEIEQCKARAAASSCTGHPKVTASTAEDVAHPLAIGHGVSSGGAPIETQAVATSGIGVNSDGAVVEGVAIVCCLDGPGWMQKRYSMSVMNVLAGLPPTYLVQLFHHGSDQALKGIRNSPGIGRLVDTGRVVLTQVPEVHKKRKRSELFLSTFFWESVLAEQVLMFGHGGVLCHNSPLKLSNFTSYDLCSSPDGGFVLVKRSHVLQWLRSILPVGTDYLPGIHGPVPYFLGRMKREMAALLGRPYIVAPEEVTDRFALVNDKSGTLPDEVHWAISGTLPNLSADARKVAIERCPEVKMIFPSLDHPGCFGASSTLNKEECLASLCVTSPKKGGC